MRSQGYSRQNLDLVLLDRRYALDLIDAVLEAGEGIELVEAFSHLALSLDGVVIAPEAVDPEEARVVLEKLKRVFGSKPAYRMRS